MDQITQKRGHYISVGVGLCQREPHATVGVQRQDQRDSGSHLIVGESAIRVRGRPDLSQEVGVVEPRLVDVDDPLVLLQQRQNL